MAEGEGFEPPKGLRPGGFQVRCLTVEASPPCQELPLLTVHQANEEHRAYAGGLLSGYFCCVRYEPLDSCLQVTRREVCIPLDHRQRAPAAELLNGPKVNTSHHESARECMSVRVPREPVQPTCIFPGRS